jgi:hypothetical protein
MMPRAVLAGLVAAFIGTGSYGQQVTFFVNNEMGINVTGCGGAANPCKSVTYMLSLIMLTPTQNAVVNVAGRRDAANNVIPYDEANGEIFPIVLTDRIVLAYDPNNSEFFTGGARVPAVIRKAVNPTLGIVVQLFAVGGLSLGPLTGLDGQTAGVGLRLLHVENGNTSVLLAASGAATNEAFLRGVTVRNGAASDLRILAQDGGTTSTSVLDSTLRTNVNTGTLLDVAAANPTTPSTSTRASAIVQSVAVSADQVGGVAVSHPVTGVAVAAQGVTGGSPFVEFEASDLTISGFTNANPSAPLGLDTGLQFSALGPGSPRVKAGADGGNISLCGLNGVEFGSITSGGDVGATIANLRVASCGFRASPGPTSLQGHGFSLNVLSQGTLDVTLQANNIFDHFLDGVFVNPAGVAGGVMGSAVVRIVSNEIHACGRDGARFLLNPGGSMGGSTFQSNRIHDNASKGIRLLTSTAGQALSATVVNNLIYGNDGGGIEIDTTAGGSSFVTMTHNTVVDNTGIGVSLVGPNHGSTVFWNGISWHILAPPGPDFSGFFFSGQINYSTWQTCAVGSTCAGTGNRTPPLFPAPQFVNPSAADYHLVNNDITNPAVDAARSNPPPPAAPQFDFEGNLRVIDIGAPGPANTLADMGADEAIP